MENISDYSDDLKTIKKIMEESSRFLSLSGLSGLFAGLLAVVGGCIAQFGILKNKTLFISESLSDLSLNEISSIKIQLITAALDCTVFLHYPAHFIFLSGKPALKVRRSGLLFQKGFF